MICSNKDVKPLNKLGILTNYDINEKDVPKLFEILYKDVTVTDFYYNSLYEQVNGYKKPSWQNRWKLRKKKNKNNKNLISNHLPRSMSVIVVLILIFFDIF